MIIGEPKKISPVFNHLYVYATSSNVNEPAFRYRSIVGTGNPPDIIGDLSIKPRFGDDLMEHNVSKIIQSKLGDLTDDIDFNDAPTSVFINTPSSGIDYVVGVNDKYQFSWDFTGTTVSFLGNITLEGPEQSIYSPGDVIVVEGLADYYPYVSITSGPNNYAKFTLSEPHNLNTGDFVLVQQNSPFQYPIYNGYYEVLIATNPLELVLNILYQGFSQLNQTGQIIFNDNLDGPAIVTLVGGSAPTYFVELGLSGTQSVLGDPLILSTTQSGTTRFVDSRVSEFPNSITGVKTTFNGGMNRKEWLEYSANDYSTFFDGFKFLTSLPNEWTTKLDNDIYLNFWNFGLDYDYLNLILTTKDCNGGIINEYVIPYDGRATASTIQTINVGPAHLNEICPEVEYLGNWDFWDDSVWEIQSLNNATGSISGGGLLYNFTGPGGVGRVRAFQLGVLTIGQNYNVCFEIEDSYVGNINFAINNGLGIVATGSGEYCFNFTASTADFIFTMDGTSGTPFAKIPYITVRNEVCDILDCDVCSYDIKLDSRSREIRNQVYPFAVEQAWNISNFFNGFTEIINGVLTYSDLIEFGGSGISTAVQNCVFTPGYQYSVILDITNNSNVQVQIGDSGEGGSTFYPIGTTGSTGVFIETFTASEPNFFIALQGDDDILNGATIGSVEIFLLNTFTASSEVFNFEIDCECEGRYTNYPIIFKDRMGSFVTFNFDLNNRQRVFKTSENYNNFVGGFDSRFLSTCNKGSYRYSLNDAGTTVFSTLIEEEWELNSDYMTNEESAYFEELVTSPRAAIKIDNNYYAVYIRDNEYERVTKNNQKMIYHKLFIRFANNNTIASL